MGILSISIIFVLFATSAFSYSVGNRTDNATFSNVEEVTTFHFHLTLSLDFNSQVANGSNLLSMISLIDNLSTVILDVRALDIEKVTDGEENELVWNILDLNPNIGEALSISLKSPKKKNDNFSIQVFYRTTSEGLSLNWLEPS